MTFGVALFLVLAGRMAATPPLLVVPDQLQPSEQAFVDALAQTGLTVRTRPTGHLDGLESDPRAIIAVGDRASEVAFRKWPGVPRASVLTWSPLSPAAKAALLVIDARPEASCTATRLASDARDGGWVVLAGPADANGDELAQALGAQLIVGSPAQARQGLSAAMQTGVRNVWLRASPEHMVPAWLRYLGRLDALPDFYVGTDAPGLSGFGLDAPARLDMNAVAGRTEQWVRQLRRRRPPKRAVEAATCRE